MPRNEGARPQRLWRPGGSANLRCARLVRGTLGSPRFARPRRPGSFTGAAPNAHTARHVRQLGGALPSITLPSRPILVPLSGLLPRCGCRWPLGPVLPRFGSGASGSRTLSRSTLPRVEPGKSWRFVPRAIWTQERTLNLTEDTDLVVHLIEVPAPISNRARAPSSAPPAGSPPARASVRTWRRSRSGLRSLLSAAPLTKVTRSLRLTMKRWHQFTIASVMSSWGCCAEGHVPEHSRVPRALPESPASRSGEAKQRFQRGVELYREGAFDAALAEFRRADDLVPTIGCSITKRKCR